MAGSRLVHLLAEQVQNRLLKLVETWKKRAKKKSKIPFNQENQASILCIRIVKRLNLMIFEYEWTISSVPNLYVFFLWFLFIYFLLSFFFYLIN